ncbi:MAG: inorganic phosphate transporter [Planctomycetota bacterium]
MIFLLIIVSGICLAYANGANDNFKGVATLFGSGTTNYRRALAWATGTTFAGSIAAFFLAESLIKSFGGKGLVDDAVASQPAFAAAVALGAGLTVLMATRIGMPISTTHGLIGALIGTGWVAGSGLNYSNLGSKFLIPLLLSPVLAVVATTVLYPPLRFLRKRLKIKSDICLCVGEETVEVIPDGSHAAAMTAARALSASVDREVVCESRYEGNVLGISAGPALDSAHFLSSGMVSFARGLNDTPKIAALLLLAPSLGIGSSLALVGIVIAIGGLVSAKRVAETMSRKITAMNHGQGLTANLITALIVIGASRFGLPVSTTHVSCGSLFGLGAVNGSARRRTIVTILMAWLITLPTAALIASVSFLIVRRLNG